MSQIRIFVAFFLLAVFLNAQCASSSQGCSNPLLQYLSKEKDLLVLPSPKSTTETVCQSFWKTHKTCCDKNALTIWNSRENTLLTNQKNYISSITTQISSQLNGLKRIYAAEFSKPDLSFIGKYSEDKLRTSILDGVNSCMEHNQKVRNSALCSLCSGISSQFIYHGKGAVGLQDCIKSTQVCQRYFQEISSLAKGMANIINIIKSVPLNPGVTLDPKYSEKSILEFSAQLNHPVIQKLNDLEKATTEIQKTQALIGVCNNYITLIKSFYGLDIYATLVENISRILESILVNLRARSASNWGRLLLRNPRALTLSLPTGIADSEVLLLPSDNMFTSFVGAPGSAQALEATSVKPMNMSLIFP